jgi:hypothetical protein
MSYTSATVYVPQVPMLDPIPSDFARASSYNYSQGLVKDIIGLGDNGWGQASQTSSPVTTRNRMTRAQRLALATDVNFIHTHVLGTATDTTVLVPPTTSTVAATITNAMSVLVTSLLPNRYVCHPSQFFGYPGAVINSLNGTSTTTTVWGREVEQRVRVDWPTSLFARYFFNSGSVFTWTPSYASIADANDRDAEWINFIDHLRASTPYEYKRADFLSTSTTSTTYNSGTLSITIIAQRDVNLDTAKRVDFTAILRNEDLPYLVVDPVRGYWNYGPWETA